MSKKGFDLEAYKKTIKERQVTYKPDTFIPVDECLQAVLGLPGVPRGHVCQIYGKSDTGKTSLLFHLAAQCQKNEELPIVYVTEKKVDWQRAKLMGFDKDGYALVEESYSTLEEVFDDMLNKLAEQARGELPKKLVFLWDSIGNTLSEDEFEDDKEGNRDVKATMMKAAKVIKGYMRHVGPKINDTRKIDVPNDATLIFLNQGYMSPPPPGTYGIPGKLTAYGGDGIWYAASLVIQTKRTGKISAKVNNVEKKFASRVSLTIEKNHINGIEQKGNFIVTPTSIIPDEAGAIKVYKEDHKEEWGEVEFNEQKD